MPTKTKEYSLFAPGKLVKTRKAIYSVDAGDDCASNGRLAAGTVGLVLSGPKNGFPTHCNVQFTGNVVWWVNFHEIEPYY